MYVRSHIKVILKETLLINVQLFLVYIISKYRILQKNLVNESEINKEWTETCSI